MYIHRIQERRIRVRYYIGGHKALNDVLSSSQSMRCRASISNREVSRWASYTEGGNVSQTPKENSGPKEEKGVEGGELLWYDERAEGDIWEVKDMARQV